MPGVHDNTVRRLFQSCLPNSSREKVSYINLYAVTDVCVDEVK
jgi:hypothetical protein